MDHARQMLEDSDYEDHEEDEIWSGLWRPRAFPRHFVELENKEHHVQRSHLMRLPLGEDALEDLLEERLNCAHFYANGEWWNYLKSRVMLVGRQFVPTLYSWQYPCASDGSFQGYHERVEAAYNPAWKVWLMSGTRTRYGTIPNNGEHSNAAQYQWQTSFLTPFTDCVGLGTWGHYSTVFLGNYNHSFGIHWDPEGVIHIPVLGDKAMRTWQPSAILDCPTLMNMTNYKEALPPSMKNSVLVKARPGGCLYWNSDVWHTHETVGPEGALCVSIALALKVQGENFIQSVGDEGISTREGPTEAPSHACVRAQMQDAASETPEEFAEQLDCAMMRTVELSHIQRGSQMGDEDLIRSTWLSFVTSCGAAHAPFPLQTSPVLLHSQTIVVHDPFVFAQGQDAMLIAANGCVFQTPLTETCCSSLQSQLQVGCTLSASLVLEVCEGANGSTREGQLVLQCLLEARAIAIVEVC